LVLPSPARVRTGIDRSQRNAEIANLYRIARALDMSLSELFVVDDYASVVSSYSGYCVEPFGGGDQWDEELLGVRGPWRPQWADPPVPPALLTEAPEINRAGVSLLL